MNVGLAAPSPWPNGDMTETLLKGRYRHLAEIGRGERTVTYKALDTSLERTVVVKVLRERYAADQQLAERFLKSARALASLSHPNIVSIYDVGSDRDLYYVVTEYVEGESLESFLASRPVVGMDESLDIVLPVSDALAAAHHVGYIHGRLTPRNILLGPDGAVKVSDFRVADHPSAALSRGTAYSLYAALYLSPEQAMGRRATPASDVYSAGVILYELLTGHPPFHGENFAEIADQHIRTEPEAVETVNPRISASLSDIVRSALAKTSADRYRTASDLSLALRDYRGGSAAHEFVEGTVAEASAQIGTPPALWPEEMPYQRVAEAETAPPVRGGPLAIDWLGCLVGMAALVAVLGLVPLWLAVYLRYLG
jgi:serine/threonine protein kinase